MHVHVCSVGTNRAGGCIFLLKGFCNTISHQPKMHSSELVDIDFKFKYLKCEVCNAFERKCRAKLRFCVSCVFLLHTSRDHIMIPAPYLLTAPNCDVVGPKSTRTDPRYVSIFQRS